MGQVDKKVQDWMYICTRHITRHSISLVELSLLGLDRRQSTSRSPQRSRYLDLPQRPPIHHPRCQFLDALSASFLFPFTPPFHHLFLFLDIDSQPGATADLPRRERSLFLHTLTPSRITSEVDTFYILTVDHLRRLRKHSFFSLCYFTISSSISLNPPSLLLHHRHRLTNIGGKQKSTYTIVTVRSNPEPWRGSET